MGIRKELMEEGTKIEGEKEGIMTGRIKLREEKWKIISVYIRRENMEYTMREVEKWAEEREEGNRIIVGGEFNVRTTRKEEHK